MILPSAVNVCFQYWRREAPLRCDAHVNDGPQAGYYRPKAVRV